MVKALWRRGALDRVELALVPVGTCNDVARRFALSRECWGRWETAVPHGRLAELTLARMAWKTSPRSPAVEGEDVFLNNAGFGRPRPAYDRRDSPWRVLLSMRPIGVHARWDEGKLEGRAYLVLAVLGPYFSGGLHFETEGCPEDGRLRFYIVPARNKVRLAARLVRGRLGGPLFDEKVTKITARRLSLETDTPVWPQADGEPPPEKPVRYLEFEALPHRVKLWVID